MQENFEQDEGQLQPEPAPEAKPAAEGTPPEDEAALLRDQLLRAMAELQNLRKRTTREIQMETRRERDQLLGEFMRVVDNLERALKLGEDEDDPWYVGMNAIHDQMLDLLRRHDAIPFDPKGAEFDPTRHEATGQIALPETPAGMIIEVLERGYENTDGTLIRPAKVIVTSPPAQ